jgi:hypothetical protein
MADLQLQLSIAGDLRSQALLALIGRLGSLDLSPILVYRIASLVDSAVIPMAWQWDVLNPLLLPAASQLATLSYASWDEIANIDSLINIDLLEYQQGDFSSAIPLSVLYADYRALILLSTKLHSIMGTPAALKQGLAGLGYADALLQEGQNSWGGTTWPADEGWAAFRISINLLTVPAGTDFTSLDKRITAICNYWKPARCWLDSVQFTLVLTDTVAPPVSDFIRNIFVQRDFLVPQVSDFIAAPFWPVSGTKTISPNYDRRYYFGSNVTYGGTQPPAADGPLIVNGSAVDI